eukprot:jgi/Ulvmu1/10349/UM061_0032.1
MKSTNRLLTSPGERAVYGAYRFLRNVLWIPSSLIRLAGALVRRELPRGFLERQGLYQATRPLKNPLLWFHANSAGECVFCLPLIHRVVVEYNEKVLILVTVRSEDALELLQSSLPDRVLLVRAPEDSPFAVGRFLDHWRPCIGVMMSAWLAPNLVVMSAQAGVPLALLDGSIPAHIFHFWHERRALRALWQAMASCFQLIIPHSDVEVGRFRLMGATLSQMPGWCNDLSYACALSAPVANLWRPPVSQVTTLEALLAGRTTWLACHVAPADDGHLQQVHNQMRLAFPQLLTVHVHHGHEPANAVLTEWAAAGAKAVCSSAMPASLQGVEVLVVDTPWLTPLLMHICEVVYIGGAQFPGEHNYAVLAQAAVASCAVIASSAVMAHVQLAQELNNAAVSAAEDAAHAVRSAGVDAESLMPWHNSHHAGHTPRSQAPAEASPDSPAAVSVQSGAAATPTADASTTPRPTSPSGVGSGSFGRPRTASRQIIFSQDPAAAEAIAELPAASAGIPVAAPPRCIGVPQHSEAEAPSPAEPDGLADDTLSTGCSTPVLSRLREEASSEHGPDSRSLALALTSLDPSGSNAHTGNSQRMRSPAQPMTPPRGRSPSDGRSDAPSQVPFGLPLSRSPLRQRARPFPDPQPHANANGGSPSASSCSTPMCHSTPTSLHISVLHPDLSSLRGGPSPSSPADTVTATDESSFEPGTVTPSKLSGEASFAIAIATPSPLPCGPKPLAYDSPAHSPASSVFPWHQASAVVPSPMPLFEGISEGCGCAATGPGGACGPVIFDGGSPGGGVAASAEIAPTAAALPMVPPPPFQEGGSRALHGSEMESGAVQVATAAAPLPANVGLAKDSCTDAPSSRSMIGSERPLSRPTTGGSATPDLAAGASVSCPGAPPDVYPAPTSAFSSGAATCAVGEGTPQVNVLQLDCSATSRDSIAGGSPCEGSMSPVATPAGLNNIRLTRARSGAAAEAAAEPEADTATTADMWAGASPFLSVMGGHTPAFEQANQLAQSEPATPAPEKPASLPVANVPLPAVSPARANRRVTVRRALLRYSDNYLLSAMHLPHHPEGPAVLLLNQPEGLLEAVSSLLREPITRQSRGYVAVQAAARLSSSLVSTIWDVLDGSVLEPALLSFEGPAAPPAI